MHLWFADKEGHEDGSDPLFEDDGEDDAAGHIQQHHPHPHTPALMTPCQHVGNIFLLFRRELGGNSLTAVVQHDIPDYLYFHVAHVNT